MNRCNCCKQIIQCHHLAVQVVPQDCDKLLGLVSLQEWEYKYQYGDKSTPVEEYGRLKCGDCYIHFIIRKGYDV
jgi:hypothetical protein